MLENEAGKCGKNPFLKRAGGPNARSMCQNRHYSRARSSRIAPAAAEYAEFENTDNVVGSRAGEKARLSATA
jgi:hypothetical protein